MTTLKRLCDDDVRAVFACLRNYASPPDHLSFRIVPVGPRGLKLSPPSHEFDDGLYVLLRPLRKKAKKGGGNGNGSHHRVDGGGGRTTRGETYAGTAVGERPQDRVPEHLAHLIMAEHELPPETCPWSLSGPQFPTPTNIQQRYCYPRGRKEYSSRKGGALWTMCDDTGKEDTEYRLLHVYLSPKRAANKGVDLSQEEKDLVYQRQHQAAAAASVAATLGAAASSAAASPKSKKARYSRKSAVIHRRTQGLQQPASAPGKASRYRPYGHHQLASAHIMVSTSTSTASPPHYGTAMLVSSPPSLSPLSFDRFPTATSTSPSSSLYRDPYGGPGHHHQLHPHVYHRSSDLAHPGHPSFDTLHPHPFASERPAPFVTPLHGTSRHRRYDPYSHRRTSSDEGDNHHQRHLATTSDDRHHRERHVHGTGEPHLPEDDRHSLRQSPLRRRESFLDDPRADPFWDGHDPMHAGDDGDDDNSIRHANTERNGFGNGPSRADTAPFASASELHFWQQQPRGGDSRKESRAAAMRPKPEGSDDGSVTTDPFGGLSIHQSENGSFQTGRRPPMGGARRSSLRHHRRSSSNSSSHSAASAIIGVTLDTADSGDPVVSPSRSLARRLAWVQRSLRDAVLSHPPALRGKLTSMVVHWAVRLKLDPLADVKEEEEEDVHDAPMAGADGELTHSMGAAADGPVTSPRPSMLLSATDCEMDEPSHGVDGNRIDCSMSVAAV